MKQIKLQELSSTEGEPGYGISQQVSQRSVLRLKQMAIAESADTLTAWGKHI